MVGLERIASVSAWLERQYIPKDVAADIEQFRRWSLVVHLGVIYATAAPFFGLCFAAVGMWLAVFGCACASVMGWFVLWGPRQRFSVRTLGQMLTVACFCAFVTATVETSGLRSPVLIWFTFGSTVAFITSGRREGILAVVGSCLFFCALLVLHGLGVMPAFASSELSLAVLSFLLPIGAMTCTGVMQWSYESGRLDSVHRVATLRKSTRRLLDSVSDGLFVVSMDGRVDTERSAAAERLLPGLLGSDTLWSAIAQHDSSAADWMELGWEDLSRGVMPLPVILQQLPNQITVEDRTLRLRYDPIDEAGQLVGVLVVLTDATDAIAAAHAQEMQHETVAFFLQRLESPAEVRTFLDEVRGLVGMLDVGGDALSMRRWIHTLKGNTATFGLASFARFLHEIEDAIEVSGEVSAETRHAIVARWNALEESLGSVALDDQTCVSVGRSSLEQLIERAHTGMSPACIADAMERWMWQDVGARLEQLAARGHQVASRLGKDHVRLVVNCEVVSLPSSELGGGFWASLVHVVRNAVDHGVESAEERVALGKDPLARIELRAWIHGKCLLVSVSDDGRGIQWDALRRRAQTLGLPTRSHDDLVESLFADGLSTSDSVSDVSGRGLGMAALREELHNHEGDVTVDSTLGEGTRFVFELPLSRRIAMSVAS